MSAQKARASRGFRNKNPGNIEYNVRNKWQGQVGLEEGSGARFAVFESHEFGIRALAALLTTYQDRHGLRTVRGIINRWAPGNENNTDAYVHAVARKLGVSERDTLDLHTYLHMRPLVEAIITHELGGQPYTDAQLDEGLRRAGIVKPVQTVREAAATGTGRGAGAVAAAVVAAAPAAPLVSSIGALPQWTGVALIVAVAVIALVVILSKRKDQPA